MEQKATLEQKRIESHPHACYNGWVFLGIIAINEETGEEEEYIKRLPCRRCGLRQDKS
jgi:hypothetical protein